MCIKKGSNKAMKKSDVKKLKDICLMDSKSLKKSLSNYLSNMYGTVIINSSDNGYVYAQGDFPVLLVAHLDTVHKELPKKINIANCVISSPQGIGGDDRCGVYMILKLITDYHCSVLFCDSEEVGGLGASTFVRDLPTLKKREDTDFDFKFLIEFDRANKKDSVFYDCANTEFEEFVNKNYFETAWGTYTDICEVAPALGIAAVNLSCGYYNAHTTKEYIDLIEMNMSIRYARDILDRSEKLTEPFKYVERVTYRNKSYSYGSWGAYGNSWYNQFDDDYDYYGTPYGIYGKSKKTEKEPVKDEEYYFEYYTGTDGRVDCDTEMASDLNSALGLFFQHHPSTCFDDVLVYGTEKDINAVGGHI